MKWKTVFWSIMFLALLTPFTFADFNHTCQDAGAARHAGCEFEWCVQDGIDSSYSRTEYSYDRCKPSSFALYCGNVIFESVDCGLERFYEGINCSGEVVYIEEVTAPKCSDGMLPQWP